MNILHKYNNPKRGRITGWDFFQANQHRKVILQETNEVKGNVKIE